MGGWWTGGQCFSRGETVGRGEGAEPCRRYRRMRDARFSWISLTGMRDVIYVRLTAGELKEPSGLGRFLRD